MSRHEITTQETVGVRHNDGERNDKNVKGEPENEIITGSLAYETYPQHQAALIDLLWVNPNHRGKKLGTTLIKACLGQLGCNIQVVFLLVSRTNVSAMKLYGRLGFQELTEARAGPYSVMGCWTTKTEIRPNIKVQLSVKDEYPMMMEIWNRLTLSK